jgi:putative oxidoreductase
MTSEKAGEDTSAELIFPFMAPIYRLGTCVSWPLVRFIAGANLIPHGARKLFGWWGGDIQAAAQGFANLGFEPGLFWAYAVAFTEVFGGLFLIFGLFTRFAAGAATIFLFTAAFYVHLSDGFWWTNHGYEYPMLWGVVTLAIFFRGGGPFSLDARIGKEL